jgi:AcrR family transcriptional regulator
MCPRTSEQFEEIRESKRRQILYAAIECFATSGYHSVSISDLAKHAGISKGLMYNYFSSKEELLKVIFAEVMDEMLGIFNPDRVEELDRPTLLKYMNKLFEQLRANLMLWKMYMAIFSQPAVLQILEKEIITVSKQPMDMLERYFAKQGYKEPALEVSFLSTLTSGVMFEFIADPQNYPLDKIKERILSLY